jgi:hypothetical protein
MKKNLHVRERKCESVVVNVLAPFAMHHICEDLRHAKYLSVMVDTSNHKSLKLVPVLVRYFVPEKGIQVQIIDFQNLTGETADHLLKCIVDVLEKFHLTDKIVAFCGRNCNANFRGAGRKGTNNVFSKLSKSLQLNIHGCAAHIVHNGVQTSADILPVDIETVVNKIFQCFHIYTVRVKELK